MTVESGCLGFGLGFGLGASGGAGSSMNPGCLGFAFGFGLGELGGAGSSLCDNESCNCDCDFLHHKRHLRSPSQPLKSPLLR